MSTTERCHRGLACAIGFALLAGCGVQPSGVIRGASPPSGAVEPATATTLYLVSDDRLKPVRRPGPRFSRAGTLALLAAGPTAGESARGFVSDVPAAAAPFSVTTKSPGRVVVTVSVPPTELSRTATDQIVCTTAATEPGSDVRVTLLGGGIDRGPLTCPIPG